MIESLKKRRKGVFRAVPVPPELLDMLDLVHAVRDPATLAFFGSIILSGDGNS